MEYQTPYNHPDNHHQFPPLPDDLPNFPELDDVTASNDFDLDFPFDVDFDDFSFADNLFLDLPNHNPNPNPNCEINPTSDNVVMSFDCDPISSHDSNCRPDSDSPDFAFLSGNTSSPLLNNDDNIDVSDFHPDFSGKISNQDSNCGAIGNLPEIDGSKGGFDVSLSPLLNNDGNNNDISNQNSKDCRGSVSSKCVSKSKRKTGNYNDHGFETRVNKFRRSNVDLEGGGRFCVGGGDENEKKKARLIRNRESAHLSRQRRKQYIEELEDKVESMMSTITELNGKISYFMTENASLRQQLFGGVMGYPPPPPMAGMSYPWMMYPPYMIKPEGSRVPLVPIPRLKPQPPTSAPKVKKSSEGKKEKGMGKTKKVASVSLLGLMFFILLFGGLVPMVNVRYGKVGDGFGEVQKGSVFMVDRHVGRYGHGNNSIGGNVSDPLVASLYVPRNDKLVKIDGNLIIHSVLVSEKAEAYRMAEGPKSSEETGLAIHESYSPYPTPGPGSNNWRYPHLDRNQNGKQMALGSGSSDFTPVGSNGMLQQWFREGLAGPMLSSGMCTEVFQFDVSPTPGSIVPATSITNLTSENRLNYTRPNKTKNRRILHGHATPLYDHTFNTTKEPVQSDGLSDGLRSNKTRSSVVVSVLVDPREVGDGDVEGVTGSKTLSRIFVVVLIDSVKYVTYSCMLPFMGSSNSHLITT